MKTIIPRIIKPIAAEQLAEETPCNQASIANSFNTSLLSDLYLARSSRSALVRPHQWNVLLVIILKLFFRHVRLIAHLNSWIQEQQQRGQPEERQQESLRQKAATATAPEVNIVVVNTVNEVLTKTVNCKTFSTTAPVRIPAERKQLETASLESRNTKSDAYRCPALRSKSLWREQYGHGCAQSEAGTYAEMGGNQRNLQ